MNFRLMVLAALSVATHASACPIESTPRPTAEASRLDIAGLHELMTCQPSNPANDRSPCNHFVASAIKRLYGIDVLSSPSGPLTANAMVDAMEATGSSWVALPNSILESQSANCSQSLANSMYVVVAAMRGSPHGHVAIVLPGTVKPSGNWGGVAPNSAAFRLDQPTGSGTFVGQPLSFAFGKSNAEKAKYYYLKR